MSQTIIDRLYEENRLLTTYLAERGEISLQNSVDNDFRKTLLLSAASYFETLLKDDLVKFVEDQTKLDHPILYFVRNKAVERQYHTFFLGKQEMLIVFLVCLVATLRIL